MLSAKTSLVSTTCSQTDGAAVVLLGIFKASRNFKDIDHAGVKWTQLLTTANDCDHNEDDDDDVDGDKDDYDVDDSFMTTWDYKLLFHCYAIFPSAFLVYLKV